MNQKNSILVCLFFILIAVTVSCIMPTPSQPVEPTPSPSVTPTSTPSPVIPDLSGLSFDENVTGVWILTWDHGTTVDVNGIEEDMFTPGSYGAAENPDWDDYYQFNSDGSGYMYERRLNITGLADSLFQSKLQSISLDENVTYTAIVSDGNGSYINKNDFNRIKPFYWGITGENKFVMYKEDYRTKEFIPSEELWELHSAPTRSGDLTKTIDKYPLKYELIIYQTGALRKLETQDGQALIETYTPN